MTAALAVLRHRRDVAVDVLRIDAGGEVTRSEPPARRAAEALPRILEHGERVAWVDADVEPLLRPVVEWPRLLASGLELAHLGGLTGTDQAAPSLARVEHDSPWVLAPRPDRRLDSWLVSPAGGIAAAAALEAIGLEVRCGGLAACLFDLARRGIDAGLRPRWEPRLLAGEPGTSTPEPTRLTAAETARLVCRLRGRRWLPVWALGRLLFDRRLPLASASAGFFAPAPRASAAGALASFEPPAAAWQGAAVEVIVPTLDRPQLVLDLLADLAAQTLPPRRVQVVEQGRDESARLDLDGRRWPFAVAVRRLERPGACRARNLALERIERATDFVLFLDDDVRLGPGVVAELAATARRHGAGAVNAAVHLPGQAPASGPVRLSPILAGCAVLVSREAAFAAGAFDERLEGGYGEDTDFGVRLRRAGFSVVLAPAAPVLHLRAAAGGFRAPFPHPWNDDPTPPRPSPVYLAARAGWESEPMRQGYALSYVLERLRAVSVPSWPRELGAIRRGWRAARKWAAALRGPIVEAGVEASP